MITSLTHKQILLGITGSVAAYKSAELVRRLRDTGASVRVVMTENAKRFITPLTMQAVSGNPVHDDLFDLHAEAAMGHIELSRWADAIIVAPATADFMARLARGRADDLLTTLCLATKAPIGVAPAMNQGMWKHTSTQENLQVLKQKNIRIFDPEEGHQACGDVGPGRMMESLEIIKKVNEWFVTETLAGKKILMTAGPTHEAIDPVRYLTNASSGKMGYALAAAASEAGAEVTLISGPVHLSVPPHVKCFPVITAMEMYNLAIQLAPAHDMFFGVAAVADYRSKHIAQQKIHKQEDVMQLDLERNPDIITAVSQLTNPPFIVGFAAETENVIERARKKREQKGMDLIITNRVGKGVGMNSDDNEVTLISKTHEQTLPLMSKSQLARKLIAIISEILNEKAWRNSA